MFSTSPQEQPHLAGHMLNSVQHLAQRLGTSRFRRHARRGTGTWRVFGPAWQYGRLRSYRHVGTAFPNFLRVIDSRCTALHVYTIFFLTSMHAAPTVSLRPDTLTVTLQYRSAAGEGTRTCHRMFFPGRFETFEHLSGQRWATGKTSMP